MQNLAYTWDALGNLITRTDTSRKPDSTYRNLSEKFDYDLANRLTKSSGIAGRADLIVAYNGLGNITSKSDVGAYTYGSSRPHAVTAAGGVSYGYDSNGSVISDSTGRSMVFTAWNQLSSATKGLDATSFDYDANRNRYGRLDINSGQTTSTRYVGGVEFITQPSGIVETKRYVGDAVLTTRSNGTSQEAYVLRDHLGSPNLIVDQTGQVLQNQSFDAFGQRRDNIAWQPLTGLALTGFDTSVTRRGYTGHEEMDALGLIHMNGRVYDARLGRFISADPNVDGVMTTQGFNRYSYLQNNPMNATDPSGFYGFHHLWRDVKPFVGAVIAIVATYLCNAFCGGSAWAWAGTLAGVGAVNGAIATGSLKGTVIGAFTGAIAGYAIGAGLGVVEAGLLNGVAGGIADQLQGGSFGHGFISAGAAAFFGGQTGQALGPIDTRNVALAFAQIAGRAIVGGTISAATGGKFSNGAISAAFSAAAEGVTAPNSDVAVTGGHGAVPANMTVVTPVFTDSNGAWLSQAFRTLNEALQAGEVASRTAAAAAGDGNEYGVATLVDQAGSFRNSSVVTSRSPEGIAWRLGPWRDQLVALNHLHPNNDLGFSQKDKDSYANWSQLKSFKGVFMFDGTGNHWYGPGREHWWGVDRTHSCGGAASSWSCDAEHPNWVK